MTKAEDSLRATKWVRRAASLTDTAGGLKERGIDTYIRTREGSKGLEFALFRKGEVLPL